MTFKVKGLLTQYTSKNTRIRGCEFALIIVVFLKTKNGISLLLPDIQFLKIALEVNWLSCQHALGTEFAHRNIDI